MMTLLAAFLLLLVARLGVSQLTSDQKQLLLDLHNQARSDVFPTAANMEEMVRALNVKSMQVVAIQGRIQDFLKGGPQLRHWLRIKYTI